MKTINKVLFILTFITTYAFAQTCQEEDYIALRALYLSTNGDNWYNNNGWPSEGVFNANPTMPTGTDVSTWYGIITDGTGCVICIDMGGYGDCAGYADVGNNLIGSIPPEIGNLSNLQALLLLINQLTGNIPAEIGNLDNLELLFLLRNQLTGSIPSEIGNLSNLKGLGFENNQLTGSIPLEFGDLSNLIGLSLQDNQLSGNIPPELGNLYSLRSMRLSDNQLTGNIPSEIGGLDELIRLQLDNNQLTGSIPPEFGNLDNLERLWLFNNQLDGCYDLTINTLCAQLDPAYNNNSYVSAGNNFNATWEDFCATGTGTCVVNVDNTQQSNFKVYPIPAHDFVVFDVPNNTTNIQVVLHDINGRQISHQLLPTDHQISVSHLNTGVYVYRLFYEDEVYSGKIIVE